MAGAVVRRRSWPRRLAGFLVVLVVVLGGLLLIADRAGATLAERTVADQVKQEITTRGGGTSEPDVTVGGFPFLTQVLRGRYDKITIVMRDVSGAGVRLPRLDIEATDVTASVETLMSGKGTVVADRVSGTATVAYASLVNLIDRPGLQLSGQNGRLVVSLPAQVLDRQVTVTGSADLSVAGGKIRVRFRDLTAQGLPDTPAARSLVNRLADTISVDVRLPALPFRLNVQKVSPRPEGLAVTATASGVPLNG